jgi:phage tail-like protein
VAGISSISPLTRTTEVKTSPGWALFAFLGLLKSPGVTKYEPIVMQRGKTHDPEFEAWAAKTRGFGPAGGASLSKDFRKDIIIEVQNEAGQPCMAYKLYQCWVSRYRPLSQLDANAPGVLIEEITIECESWERDTSVTEPVEH